MTRYRTVKISKNKVARIKIIISIKRRKVKRKH